MTKSVCKAVIAADIKTVWDTIRDFADCGWRGDILKTEILDERRFVEYTKSGFATNFVITEEIPCRKLQFDIDNKNIGGVWTGSFAETPDGTEVVFTEQVKAKKPMLKPFVKIYLKKQQKRYMADLQNCLNKKQRENQ